LADERILKLLPSALGKTFYKSQTKRPIPVVLTGKADSQKPKKTPLDRLKTKVKDAHLSSPANIGQPADMAADIEKALSVVPVHLSPSVSTSIKIGYAGWPAEWISANVEAVVNRVVDKWIPGQWPGVKSIYIRGPRTASLPIYMAREDWITEDDVLDEGEPDTELNFRPKSKEEKKELQKQKKLARKLAEEDAMEIDDDVPQIEDATPSKKRKRDPVAGEGENQAADVPEPVDEPADKPVEAPVETSKKKKTAPKADKVSPKKRKVAKAATEAVLEPDEPITTPKKDEGKKAKKGKAKKK
jgi:ribosome biogenesis protein UTP30